ncbi:hypothetical protein [Leisingera sp. JC11]|uniref:hypothetical protein n=1 Tax=Leisingera sp. JC11 TaxID=3042469 RepID=UPI003453B4E4
MPPEQDTIKIKTGPLQGEATGKHGIVALVVIVIVIFVPLWDGIGRLWGAK